MVLALGFLWLAFWCAGSLAPQTQAIADDEARHYPGFAKYSGDEVAVAVRSALAERQAIARNSLPPAVIMLIGVLLLELSRHWEPGKTVADTDIVSLEGPAEFIANRFVLRIPLAVGGGQLAAAAGSLGKVEHDHLVVTLPRRLVRKLKIEAGTVLSVDNHQGRLNITRSQEIESSTPAFKMESLSLAKSD